MALELLAVALWVVFGGAGAWLLVTGRNTFFGLPLGLDDTRLRRLFGLVWVLVAAFFLHSFSQGSFSPWPVFWLYGGLGSAFLVDWWKARDARA
jgi:uncharacterized membrane protein YjgN (DUF898 family)